MKSKIATPLLSALVLAACIAPGTGCVSLPEENAQPKETLWVPRRVR